MEDTNKDGGRLNQCFDRRKQQKERNGVVAEVLSAQS